MSMAIFSPKLPTVAPPTHGKTHLNFKPYLLLKPKRLQFQLVMSADISSGMATTETPAMDSNGSPPSAVVEPVADPVKPVAAEAVSNFQDARWVRGTWDLKQFVKNGETNWDAVIDAEVKRRKWMQDTPQSSSNEDPVFFDTAIIPWWAWMKRFHLPEAELLNGRAAMVGFFMAYFVDSLTGVGLVDQMGNFFCKTLLFVAVAGVLFIRKNEDIDNLKKLFDETTFYDKQWQAAWQDETPSSPEK